jgi:hypothetical protein
MLLEMFCGIYLVLKRRSGQIGSFLMATLRKNLLIKFKYCFFRWNAIKFEFKELYYIILLCYHLDKEPYPLKTTKFWHVLFIFTLEFSLNVFTPKKKENP